MSYSEYFIEQFNDSHKAPILNQKQLHRIFKIIDTEGRIDAFSNQDFELRKTFRGKLKELTGNKQPHLLLAEMIKLSK